MTKLLAALSIAAFAATGAFAQAKKEEKAAAPAAAANAALPKSRHASSFSRWPHQ